MRHAFTTLAVVLSGVLLLAQMAMAQDKDPRITELVERMKADIEAGKTAEIEMAMDFEFVGTATPPMLQGMVMHMWRDHGNMRVEMPHMNMVIVLKDDELTMYQGMMNFGLHMTPDAMVQIKTQQEQVLQGLGLPNDPDEMVVAMLEKGLVTIAGEETVDGVDCWVLEIAPESLQAMMGAGMPMEGMFAGMGGGQGITPEITQMTMLVEKETASPKRIDMGMNIAQEAGVAFVINMKMTFTEAKYGIEIPAALFAFEMPEGVNVVEWTADKDLATVMQEIQAATMQGVQQMQQQEQQQGQQQEQ